MPDGVAHPVCVDFAAGAIGIDADDATNSPLAIKIQLVFRRHVKRLTKRDIKLSIRADFANARGVVIAFLGGWDQITLLDHVERGNVRAFIEKLGRREHQNTVLFGDIKEPVRREARTVRDAKSKRRGEVLDLVGDTVLVAVGDRPNLVLARANKGHNPLWPDGNMAGIGDNGIKTDLETIRKLDALKGLFDPFGVITTLFDDGEFCRSG